MKDGTEVTGDIIVTATGITLTVMAMDSPALTKVA